MPNVAQIIQEAAEVGVVNSRLSSNFMGWASRAQREICDRIDLNFAFNYSVYTIATNGTSVSLGPNFKRLAPERSPVNYLSNTNGAPISVTVSSRAQLSRYFSQWASPYYQVTSPWIPPMFLFLEQDAGGNWTLNLPPTVFAQVAINYGVSAYYYPPDFASGSDSNGLTTHPILCTALINRIKAMAYSAQDPTDPRGLAANALCEQAIMQAAYADTRTRASGRSIHM